MKTPEQKLIVLGWCLLGVLLPGLWHLPELWQLAQSSPLPTDTRLTYLPYAERLLEDPIGYFSNPEHLYVPPGTPIYMALLKANLPAILWANLTLSAGIIVLLFDCGRRLSGFLAGTMMSWFYVALSGLPPLMALPLSEAPYLFLTACWLWSCVLVWSNPDRIWPLWLGALTLSASVLTRGLYLYWLPIALVILAVLAILLRDASRQRAGKLLLMHALAVLPVLAFITHNQLRFDFAGISTGGGIALYLGSNPITFGYEPLYSGLGYDEWMVTGGVESHLTLASDAKLVRVAKAMLLDMPLPVLLDLYSHKLGANLFFSQANLTTELFNDRSNRLVLLLLALIGCWHGRKHLIGWMLFGISIFLLLLLSLVMHNPRYSHGALDLPLIILAGMGTVHIWQTHHRYLGIGLILGACSLLIFLGHWQLRHAGPLLPRLETGHAIEQLRANGNQVNFAGLTEDPMLTESRVQKSPAQLIWPELEVPVIGGTPVVSLDINRLGDQCSGITFAYHRDNGEVHDYWLETRHLSFPRTLHIGGHWLGYLAETGKLLIEFHCPPGQSLAIGGLSINNPSMGRYYVNQGVLENN
ncbi:hypothetical protein [Halopseudomonas salegens]|uniref:Dolichyl-phosphate-mannose-protein mannosyltransferase n=1 Tax=Halopseudomonas salegens TaxID=1434072 RepID=A0A1H2HTC7_9GAMM|nr:hypothetical protein [Halopseudomonas salegens]SDU35163.1 hypothetical protein SAMN05216210_3298 [Halopseudomonas salegens]